MRGKKLQVFVSSTYSDLIEERQAAVEAILSSSHIPAGMELFAAGDESQMTVIERWIDESDVYLLILGGRYGSIEKSTGKSYTHLEYEYALSKSKPLFALVINEKTFEDKVKTAGLKIIEQENPGLLKEFRGIVLNNLVKFWDDKKDIKIAIHETLSDLSYRKDLNGWVRASKVVDTGFLAEEIARLTKENSELRIQLDNTNNSSNALYSSLSYNQLEKLLKEKSVKDGGIDTNLFAFVLKYGELLAKGTGGSSNNLFEALVMYKLVKRTRISVGSSHFTYSFTEDGHNFYLKALVLTERVDG
jgi:hypothetical protein